MPLTSLFSYADADGAGDVASFTVEGFAPGRGYLTHNGVFYSTQQGPATVPISDLANWAFVAGPNESDGLYLQVTDSHGVSSDRVTAFVTAVPSANIPVSGIVTMTGNMVQGSVIAADASLLQDSDGLGTFHYQWEQIVNTTTNVKIGTDSPTYTLAASDAGTVVTVVVSYIDGHGTLESSSAAARFIHPLPAPVLTGAGNTTGYVEQAAPVAIDPGLSVSDPNAANLVDAVVTIASGFVAGDTLSFTNQNGISGSYDSAAHVLTLSGTASLAAYQAALRSVGFSSDSHDPTNGGHTARSISFQVSDGAVSSSAVTSTVTITPIDDPPAAHNDAFGLTEATAIGAGLSLFADNGSGADNDPDGPALQISAVNGQSGVVGTQIALASGALLTVNADGTFAYNPNHAFDTLPAPGSGASNTTATDSFTYTLAGSNSATVTLTVIGVDSNDTLLGTHGNDTFDGGIGTDTVVLTGAHTDYAVSYDGVSGRITFADQRAGSPDGTDTAINVEQFRFSDGLFTYNTAAQVTSQVVVNGDGSTTTTLFDPSDLTP